LLVQVKRERLRRAQLADVGDGVLGPES